MTKNICRPQGYRPSYYPYWTSQPKHVWFVLKLKRSDCFEKYICSVRKVKKKKNQTKTAVMNNEN